ncbi:MAG: hypothetical protein ACYTFI_06655 [Planctomycetota bacterium]|jgi:hypothetical protein
MLPGRPAFRPTLLGLALLLASPVAAQIEDRQDTLPDPIPPPKPAKPPPKDAPKYKAIVTDAPEEQWGLSDEFISSLQRTAEVYEEYARRFVCDEDARLAEYDDAEEVNREKVRKYGYLLLRGSVGEPVREFRQNIGKDGKYKGEVDDSEPFPPAYMWVFLFSKFYEPYFNFRLVDTRFEGFDLVHEVHFRGSLPFTDGKDIRQWEGRALIDAFYFTPLELEAEPIGQKDRLEGLYRIWSQSFNLLGFRTGKKPLGYNARLSFGFKKGDLRFPTSLRYDTRRAVGPDQLVIVRASTRDYSNYEFTGVTTEDPRIGDVVQSQPTPRPDDSGSQR